MSIKENKLKIMLIISFAALLFMITPATVKGIMIMFLLVVAGVIICWCSKRDYQIAISKKIILKSIVNIILLSGIGVVFIERWIYSSIVGRIAELIHLSSKHFLVFFVVLLSFLANYFLLYLEEKTKSGGKHTYIGLIFSIIIFQSIQVQYSAVPSIDSWVYVSDIMILMLNIILMCIPNFILLLCTGSWLKALVVSSVIYSLFSVINYYVTLFHGSPIATTEVANFKTALNVASGYKISIDEHILFILALLVAELMVLRCLYHVTKVHVIEKRRTRQCGCILLIVSILFTYVGLFSSLAAKPEQTIRWSWNYAMQRYGYATCLVEDFGNAINPYVEPEGYDIETIHPVDNTSELETTECPDIILILNESFYDLNLYTNLETDLDYMEAFYQVEDAVYGYAVTPSIGGGTNNSEYELLTSNSMALLSSAAPFNYLNLTESDNNVIRYLESLGYQTFGMHCKPGTNYSRGTAYPDLGFDKTFFSDDFQCYSKNGERSCLDSENYQDMLELCGTEDDNPRFMYLLTFQNHGDYEQNEDSYDTVHMKNDLGSLTDDVNEYLSSMKISCEAFVELTDVLKDTNKPTIVCMVGDHAPAFIKELGPKEGMKEDEKSIYARMTPYVIWANYDIDYEQTVEFASMVDLVPMLADAAGLPLTDYYRYILDMHELVPVRTSDKLYMDVHNEIGKYEEDSPYYDLLTQYYFMEYNALSVGEDYRRELFVIQ